MQIRNYHRNHLITSPDAKETRSDDHPCQTPDTLRHRMAKNRRKNMQKKTCRHLLDAKEAKKAKEAKETKEDQLSSFGPANMKPDPDGRCSREARLSKSRCDACAHPSVPASSTYFCQSSRPPSLLPWAKTLPRGAKVRVTRSTTELSGRKPQTRFELVTSS